MQSSLENIAWKSESDELSTIQDFLLRTWTQITVLAADPFFSAKL